MNYAIVIGASGGIARALIDTLSKQPDIDGILAVSRHGDIATDLPATCQLWPCQYDDDSIAAMISQWSPFQGHISHVFICNGILHNATIQPERKLEDIDADALLALYHANAIVPALWLKHLIALVKGQNPCRIAAISARVGSIEDNGLGGWYGYRASKAALNMLLKNAGIEYGRRAKNVKLLAFHPGTTDTALSKPFQKSVPAGKLFHADFVAEHFLQVMNGLVMDGKTEFRDWDNTTIPW